MPERSPPSVWLRNANYKIARQIDRQVGPELVLQTGGGEGVSGAASQRRPSTETDTYFISY